jgi:hypothetical protein
MWLTPLLLIMAASGAMTFALTLLQQRYLLRLENALSLGMSSRFVWHVLHLPVEFFTQRYAGEIGGSRGSCQATWQRPRSTCWSSRRMPDCCFSTTWF